MRNDARLSRQLKLSSEVRDFHPPITGEMKGDELRSCGGGLLNSYLVNLLTKVVSNALRRALSVDR